MIHLIITFDPTAKINFTYFKKSLNMKIQNSNKKVQKKINLFA